MTDFAEGALIAVLTTEPLGRPLDYRAPPGGCSTGALVEVPLGPRRVAGVVWGPGSGTWDPAKVRAAFRDHYTPDYRSNALGLRLARTLN